jgi:hypothetical protein
MVLVTYPHEDGSEKGSEKKEKKMDLQKGTGTCKE